MEVGQRFGRLVVLAEAPKVSGRRAFVFRCDCGAEKTINASNVKRGLVGSCGCVRASQMAALGKASRKHGHAITATTEYRIWCGIIQRCTNENAPGFKDYGARGITIAPEWRADFEAFFLAVGPRPSKKHSIDRIDNSRGYEPGNVRWATAAEQANNTRWNHFVVVDGVKMTLAEAITLKGQRSNVVRQRLAFGWPLERALNEPIIPRSSRGKKRFETARPGAKRTGRRPVH